MAKQVDQRKIIAKFVAVVVSILMISLCYSYLLPRTEVEIDTTREVEVQFVATNNATMPWEFYPVEHKVVVHPGEQKEIVFYAKNLTGMDMVGQAIPNVLPNNAADYFLKTECFCFNNQPLTAGDDAELAVVFIIDPDLPASVNTVTLSYTIFDITDRGSMQVSQLK